MQDLHKTGPVGWQPATHHQGGLSCPLQHNYTAERAQFAEDALNWREVWCHALGRESASLQALDTVGEFPELVH